MFIAIGGPQAHVTLGMMGGIFNPNAETPAPAVATAAQRGATQRLGPETAPAFFVVVRARMLYFYDSSLYTAADEDGPWSLNHVALSRRAIKTRRMP